MPHNGYISAVQAHYLRLQKRLWLLGLDQLVREAAQLTEMGFKRAAQICRWGNSHYWRAYFDVMTDFHSRHTQPTIEEGRRW